MRALVALLFFFCGAAARAQDPVEQKLRINFALQDALAWAGVYDGVADGSLGEKSIAAIAEFQRRNGMQVTGDLSPTQASALLELADQNRRRLGFQVVRDTRAGFALGIPTILVSERQDSQRGSVYLSRDRDIQIVMSRFDGPPNALRELFKVVSESRSMTALSYKRLARDWFVVAGNNGKSEFYHSARQVGSDIHGFTFEYPLVRRADFGPVVIAMANSHKEAVPDYAWAASYFGASAKPAVAGFSTTREEQAKREAEQEIQREIEAFARTKPDFDKYRSAMAKALPLIWQKHPDLSFSKALEIAYAEVKGDSARGGTGSGIVVSTSGHILTNAHVVDDCSRISVGQPGVSSQTQAQILSIDKRNDLALLRAPALSGLIGPAIRRNVRLGENVAVFGYPLFSIGVASSGNFTQGSVTATTGLRDDSTQMQISAAVQPGNSGGPLLDQHGSLLGVVVGKINALGVAKQTGAIPEQINFAIRSSVVSAFLETHGVVLPTASNSLPALPGPDLADRAKSFSVLITCTGS